MTGTFGYRQKCIKRRQHLTNKCSIVERIFVSQTRILDRRNCTFGLQDSNNVEQNIELFSLTHLTNDLFTLVVFKPIKVDPQYNKP